MKRSVQSQQIHEWYSWAKDNDVIKSLLILRETQNHATKDKYRYYIIDKDALFGEYVLWADDLNKKICEKFHFYLVFSTLFKYRDVRIKQEDGLRKPYIIPEENLPI